MRIGIQFVFQNHQGTPDVAMFRNELQLAVDAEAMGYDYVGFVEHHFSDYAMCPDNAQALSWVAAKTKTLKLMPAAFILPWNDPLRVIEKTVMLDIVSEGRVILGLGRGLARMEYVGLRTDMAESRDRFDQAAQIILDGLRTNVAQADTPYYSQPPVDIRPRGERSFADRCYMVGMSPASIEVAGRLGLGCLKFSQGPWDKAMPEVNAYRDSFRKHQGRRAPPIIVADLVSCFADPDKAAEKAWRHMGSYLQSVMSHYELAGTHFKDIPAYASYAAAAEAIRTSSMGPADALAGYIGANLSGTPEQILDTLQARDELIGDYDLSLTFSYGSMPYEDVWEQAKLFAEKVMPKLRRTRREPAAEPVPAVAHAVAG